MLLKHFGTTERVIRQGPIIHNLAPSPTRNRLRKAHPCREGISIWRPVRGGLGPENGLFKVYPGSHHIRTEDELQNSKIEPVEIRISANQVLIAYGSLWIEEGNGDGVLMWMGVSAGIIGLQIDKYCLTFVALAHGAGRFLLRDQPPQMVEVGRGEAPEVLVLPLQERLTRSSDRSETALGVLGGASTKLESIQMFLRKLWDPTELILLCDYSVGQDPRTAYTTAPSSNHERWFIRVLTLRYLAQRFHKNPVQTIANFIREEHLPETRAVRNGIENGLKMYAVEMRCREPGIWLILMGEISKLPLTPVSEVRSAPQLLLEGYHSLMNAANRWSRIMVDSSRLYELCMSELLCMLAGASIEDA